MNWTKNPPTKLGWYWSDIWDSGVELVRVDYGVIEPDSLIAFSTDGIYSRIAAHPDAIWYGPLTPPPLPKEEQ